MLQQIIKHAGLMQHTPQCLCFIQPAYCILVYCSWYTAYKLQLVHCIAQGEKNSHHACNVEDGTVQCVLQSLSVASAQKWIEATG